MLTEKKEALVCALIDWFSSNARDLAWRRTRDPYAVWVSEIMLQQTQVKTVIPYWERWMKEFPTIGDLANAEAQRVLKLWEGLGYYTRARNLQKAAQIVKTKHQSKFPQRFEEVLALPGIGRYTAGAICSVAFNQPAPILDGNVIRVLARLFGVEGNPRDKTTNEQLWALAQDLVSLAGRGNPPESWACSRLNQALMELGALICIPARPDCRRCPVHRRCAAHRTGRVNTLPKLPERVGATARRFAAFIAEENGRFLVRQRGAGVVNARFWEFPNVELFSKSIEIRRAARTLLKRPLAAIEPFCTIKHTITRYRISLEAYTVRLKPLPTGNKRRGQWLHMAALRELPFTSAHRKLINEIATRSQG